LRVRGKIKNTPRTKGNNYFSNSKISSARKIVK